MVKYFYFNQEGQCVAVCGAKLDYTEATVRTVDNTDIAYGYNIDCILQDGKIMPIKQEQQLDAITKPKPDETDSNIDTVGALVMTSLQVDVLEAITGLNDIVMSQAEEIAALKEGVKQ